MTECWPVYANIAALPNRWPSGPSPYKTFLSRADPAPAAAAGPQPASKDWFEHLQINDSFFSALLAAHRLRYGNYQLHGIYHIQGLNRDLASRSRVRPRPPPHPPSICAPKFIKRHKLYYVFLLQLIYLISRLKSDTSETSAVWTFPGFSADYTTDGSQILSVLTLGAQIDWFEETCEYR